MAFPDMSSFRAQIEFRTLQTSGVTTDVMEMVFGDTLGIVAGVRGVAFPFLCSRLVGPATSPTMIALFSPRRRRGSGCGGTSCTPTQKREG